MPRTRKFTAMTVTVSQPSAIEKDPRRFPFPPALPILALLISWVLGRIWPVAISWPAWSFWLGLALVTLPFGLAIWAVSVFRQHGTVVKPTGDVTRVVSAGPFKYTRNPMYVSLMILYVGGMLLFRLPWALVLLVPLFLALQFGVILPEEKYLRSKFGEVFFAYERQVRRWL
jgi:protein-S-isoprenylcysteine O-methyltransferase Ste14